MNVSIGFSLPRRSSALDVSRTLVIPKPWKWFAGALGLLVLAACSTAPTDCSLGTFVVNDPVDIDDGRCDLTHCTLREAVNAANTCAVHESYTIDLPPGAYELHLRGNDWRGDLNIDRTIVINGGGTSPDDTVIRGEETWIYSIFSVSTGGDLLLTNLTVEGGNAAASGGAVFNRGMLTARGVNLRGHVAGEDGGAVYNAGTADLEDVSITDNRAGDCGGGVYNRGEMRLARATVSSNEGQDGRGLCNEAEGSLTLEASTVRDNGQEGALSYRGGGVYHAGRFLRISGTSVSNNRAGRGGGIFGEGGGGEGANLVIEDSEISGNQANFGGGLYAGPAQDVLGLSHSIVEGNTAVGYPATSRYEAGGGLGGGLYFASPSYDVFAVVIRRNVADRAGGGVYASGGDETGAIHHSAVIDNSVVNGPGGGVFVEGTLRDAWVYDSFLAIQDTTISRNQSLTGLGLQAADGADVTLIHVTISQHAGSAVVVDGLGEIKMENSLIGDNATDCAGPQERFRSQGGNAVDDRVACNLGAPGDALFAVAGTGFLPLTEVAGTWVNPLLPGHPAVDYLDDVERECGSPDDQRRVERPQGAGCDIGAFEADARTLTSGETELELATVTPTASLTQGDVTAVLTSNARCRAGPGLVYDDYDFFTLGQSTQVFARLADSSWYQVKAPILPGMCWTGQSVLEFDVSPEVLLNLPVLRPPPTPTSAPVVSAPNAPSGLQANEVACNASDGYRVKLTWSDNSGNESGFRIYHDGQVVATVGADVEQFTHTVPDDYGQQQSYRVEAYNDAGAAKSNTATEDGCLY